MAILPWFLSIPLAIGLAGFPAHAGLEITSGKFVLIANGVAIGSTVVTRETEDEVTVQTLIDSNGRGQKLEEHVKFGPNALPLSWSSRGKSEMGLPVEETFEARAGTSRWKTINDQGSAPTDKAIYIPAERTLWDVAIIARAAIAGGGRATAVPSGQVTVQRLREVTLGGEAGRGGLVTQAVALQGHDVSPDYVLLEPNGSFVAYVSDGYVLVQERFAKEYERLSNLGRELDGEGLAKLAKDFTHKVQGPIYLRDVRVFDPKTGAIGKPTTVVVFGDRIASVRPDAAAPHGASQIQCLGGTLLPGLHDHHRHMGAWDGPLLVASGVTSVRDPGNDNESLPIMTQQMDAGAYLGPRITAAGFIEGESPFSNRSMGILVASPQAGISAVRWYADHGFREVKLYNSIHPDWVKPMADEAHQLGMRVAGHLPAFMTAEEGIRAGYDEVTHLNQLILGLILKPGEDTRTLVRFTAVGERLGTLDLQGNPFRHLVSLMKERGTRHDPTLQVFEWSLLGRPGQAPPSDGAWLGHFPAPIQRARRTPLVELKPENDSAYKAAWVKLQEIMRTLYMEGIPLYPGTDFSYPGVSLQSELVDWVTAGIPPGQVLRAATLGASRAVGREFELGSVEPGKLADLLLVDGDPVADIQAIYKVRLVMKGGNIFYPDEIHQAFGVTPFASHPKLEQAP